MTGHLTGHAAQARIDDMLRQAEHHRQADAAQLDRLSGRWMRLAPRRSRVATAQVLVADDSACR
jgi:hypothetical protein